MVRRVPTRLKLSRHEVDALFRRRYTPPGLLAAVDRDLGPVLAQPAGVGQGYRLGEHVLMVLGLFDTYFAHRDLLPSPVDPDFMRLILLLHDIGKPAAIANGNKADQHDFNRVDAGHVLDRLLFPRAAVRRAQALVGRDPIGHLIKTGATLAAAESIRAGANEADLDPLAFLAWIELYFCCDAGSYTLHGGGKPGLDRLFVFDPPARRMGLAPDPRARVDAVARALAGSAAEVWRQTGAGLPPLTA
ncbi:hypothetical protein [Rhodovibrio salinarum]|uniref:HD domain-containing protein n=1 Tax=Rhodovibrio salinarum TaxID=1087 RepID=A0A934QN30_9PROT|nr:hypothetical protein [Rhodovibrio salinarum]MBK1699210.1 hypothetical protein [Rhodovibrio salinarum]